MIENLRQTNNTLIITTKENTNLKAEVMELRKDVSILNSQVTTITTKCFDFDTKNKNMSETIEVISEEKKVAELLAESLKKKMVEGEYSAYCFRLKDRSPIDSSLQDMQLVLRKNCDDQSVFEFENKNGDLRVLKASLISDIESDMNSRTRFCIKYKPYGLFGNKSIEYYESENRNRVIGHIKNFITRNQHQENTGVIPSATFKRNMVDDLKRLFFG